MDFKLLKNKNFTLYLFGKLISVLGSNIQQFALSLYVFALTGSTTLFATMISVSVIPRLLLSPIAGVFGDWFDRKKMIVRLDFFNGFLLLLIAAIYITQGGLDIWLIIALIILLEMVEIFYGSSSAAIIPSVVSKDNIAKAKSMQSVVFSSANLLSPIIAAVLFGFAGLFIILLFNGISFMLCAVAELFMRIPKTHQRPQKINVKQFFIDLNEGLSLIKNNAFISSLIYLATAVNFIVGPLLYIGFIYLIMDVLSGSEFQYGLFNSILAASMLLAPIIGARLIQQGDVRKICVYGVALVAVIFGFMAIIPSPYFLSLFNNNTVPFISLVALAFMIGLIITITNISISTMFAKVVPLNAMGRTATVMNLLITISLPIGQITMGFLLDTLPGSYVIILSSGILIIAVLLIKKTMLNASLEQTQKTMQRGLKKEVLVNEV